MAKYFISKLQIEGFRGINNENDPLEIKFKSDRVNSIFASNAQGKSSIFEALSFAIKGTIPKLNLLPQSELADNYYINQFHSGQEATVILTLQPDDGSAEIVVRVKRLANGNRVVDSPSGFTRSEQLLTHLNSEFCLLDYKSFLDFVEETPLKRGRAFSSLLGLGKISAYRQALEVLSNVRNVNTDFEILILQERIATLSRKKNDSETQVGVLCKNLTGNQLLVPINYDLVISQVTTALQNIAILKGQFDGKSLMSVDFNVVKEHIKSTEHAPQQDRLRQLTPIITELEFQGVDSDESSEVDKLNNLIATLNDNLSKTKGPLTKAHYEGTITLLKSSEWGNDHACPTCEGTFGYSLTDSLGDKLLQYITVETSHDELKKVWEASKIRSKMNELAISRHLVIQEGDRTKASDVSRRLKKGNVTTEDFKELTSFRTKLESLRSAALANMKAEQEKLQKELPPSLVALTEQIARAENLKKQISDLSIVNRDLAEASKKHATRNRWAQFITAATQSFAKAEVSLSTARTLSLESSYKSLYQTITNNTEVVPKLIKQSSSEGLVLNLEKFYGKTNLAASALLSESYRNALALSIFLSAAIQNAGSSFIVFDDVTSSFDSGHQFSLMEVFRTKITRPNNTNGPQVIVLSHDGLLEKYFDKVSSTALWHHQRLSGLSPNGTIFTQTQNVNRLKTSATQFLQAGQIDQAEPLVRQYLEFKLLEIIQRVNIPVPIDFSIRDDRKMVQNCIDAITHSVNLYSSANQLILTPAQKSSALNTLIPSIIANWLSHYSTGVAASLTPQVILGVLASIDQIADCFMYDCTCSGGIQRRYYKSLSSKHCQCV